MNCSYDMCDMPTDKIDTPDFRCNECVISCCQLKLLTNCLLRLGDNLLIVIVINHVFQHFVCLIERVYSYQVSSRDLVRCRKRFMATFGFINTEQLCPSVSKIKFSQPQTIGC